MSAWAWVAVWFLGGAAALLRVGVDALVVRALPGAGTGSTLVLGTFVVNVSGAFALGLVDGAALTGDASILIGTATIGAYTTFSTWMLQAVELHGVGATRRAVAYLLASLAVGLGAVALGHTLT